MNDSPYQQNARLNLALITIGEALTELGNIYAQGGVNDHNHFKRGQVALALERAAAAVRGIPFSTANILQDIEAFHIKFNMAYEGRPRLLEEGMARFRAKFLAEEASEFADACETGDLPQALDSLIDLAYVTFGSLYLMGLQHVFWEGWSRVHGANMRKELASDANPSPRGYRGDVVKPVGWTPPMLEDLVR